MKIATSTSSSSMPRQSPEDICIRIEAFNRGPEAAELHLLPHLWFRNTWAWTDPRGVQNRRFSWKRSGRLHCARGRRLERLRSLREPAVSVTRSARAISTRPGGGDALFTNNETNAARRLRHVQAIASSYVKDAFHRYIIERRGLRESCKQVGTKACIHYSQQVPAGRVHDLASAPDVPDELPSPLNDVDEIVRRAQNGS